MCSGLELISNEISLNLLYCRIQTTALWSIFFSFFSLSGIWLLTLTMVWMMDKNLTILVLRKIIVYDTHSLFLPGSLPPACQRSILVLSMGMLMFAVKIFHIPDLHDFLKSSIPNDVSI